MDNLKKQDEEIESLKAIYDIEFQTEDKENRKYSILIVNERDNKIYVKLYIKFPDSYPSLSAPIFEISAPYLKHETKLDINNLLNNIYLSCIGQNIVFQWIEKIREKLQSLNLEAIDHFNERTFECANSNTNLTIDKYFSSCPIIYHGDIISDRKNTFQGHAAAVRSMCHVQEVILKLKENRKIQQATHNMYAYKFYDENTKKYDSNYDNDGESQGGSRLLNLLQVTNAQNVVVIVSRWYGGIHLGPDRFKHINNAAKQVLVANNLISIKQK